MTDMLFGNELDANFWNTHWRNGQTGWDIGYASTPIANYLEQYADKDAAVLIPGCGNAYEAACLVDLDFTNITLMDIAEVPVMHLREKFSRQQQVKVLCEDFFQHTGSYDLIIEQTFFCAQVLERRIDYVRQMASLLKPGGKLVGLLFGIDFPMEGPPFGGNIAEYQKLFEPEFNIGTISPCYNSIPPRAGTELFIKFVKK